MITGHIDPKDLAEFNRDMKALRPKNLLRGEVDPMSARIIKKASKYAPPVAGSQRTGYLGNAWYRTLHGDDFEIGNLASYAGWVHGEEQTATHRRHGWKRLFEVAATEADKLYKRVEKRIKKSWHK